MKTSLVASLFVSLLLPAQAMFWDADGANPGAGGATPTGTWGVDAYWGSANGDAATTGWTVGEEAIFSAGTDASGTFTVNVAGTQVARKITFQDGDVTLSGGTLDITNATVQVDATATAATINSVVISSTGLGLDKAGPGTLTIGGANTYTGPTTVTDGVLKLGAAEVIPNGSALTVAAGKAFDLNGFNETVGSLASVSTALVSLNGGTLTAGGDDTSTTFDGIMAGPTGIFVKAGAGTLTKAAGTITNEITITGGVLSINNRDRLGTTALPINLNGGTLRNSNTGAGNTFLGTGTAGTLNRPIVIGPSGGTVSADGGALTVSSIYFGVITGPGNTLTKTGTGEFRYTSTLSNTFARLVVNQGMYRVGSTTGALGDPGFGGVPASFIADGITINNGALIGGSLTITINTNRGITLGAGGGGVTTTAASMNIPSHISGPGALNKDFGAVGNPLVLGASNSFAGGINLTFGRIDLNATHAAGTGPITVTPNGANCMLVKSTTVSPAANAVITNVITLNTPLTAHLIDIAANSGQRLTLQGKISGPPDWIKNNAGSTGLVVLENAANDFSGNITVFSGGVVATANGALGTTAGGVVITNIGFLGFENNVNYTAAEPVNVFGTGPATGALRNLSGTNAFAGPITLYSNAVVGADSGRLTLTGVIGESSGPIAITNVGAGAVILGAANSYAGGTTVNGTLLVTNTTGSGTGSGSVTVNANGTLGGNGTIAGAVTSTGKISPGSSAGTLTLQNGLNLSAGGNYVWELAANSTTAGNFDQIALSGGNLVLNGTAKLSINFTGTATPPSAGDVFWTSPRSWTVVALSGGAANPGSSDFVSVANGVYTNGYFTTSISGGNVLLNFTPGPPPQPGLISPSGAGTASVTVSFTNLVKGATYQIQSNTNLSTADWVVLTSGVATTGALSLPAGSGTEPQCYYRAVLIP